MFPSNDVFGALDAAEALSKQLRLTSNMDLQASELIYPWEPFDKRGVRQILTEDAFYRKKKRWPLIPITDFKYYISNDTLYSNFDKDYLTGHSPVAVIRFKTMTPKQQQNSLFYVGPSSDIYRINKSNMKLFNLDAAERTMYKNYPDLRDIFLKYKGKIAVCGGFVTRILTSEYPDTTDCDLFFYNCTEDEATVILLDCLAMICSNYSVQINIKVEHKLNVTNVLINTKRDNYSDYSEFERTYQFIHRVYPSLDSILGGFDLGPSMLAFDGEMIYGTPLGAFSIAKRVLVVDTTRRSISFSHRIKKYCNIGFMVVFPGMDLSNITSRTHENLHRSEQSKIEEVLSVMKRINLRVCYEEILQGKITNLLSNASPVIKVGDLKFDVDNCYMKTPRILISKKDKTPEEFIKKYSDYSGIECFICEEDYCRVNMVNLRTNNLDAVCTYVNMGFLQQPEKNIAATKGRGGTDETKISYDHAYETISNMINSPIIIFDPSYYLEKAIEHIQYPPDAEARTRPELRLFAEFVPEYRRLEKNRRVDSTTYVRRVNEIVMLLNQRMVDNAKLMEEKLKGIRWITQDPGRQWSSSINPVIADPKDFYGEWYTPFELGISQDVHIILTVIWRNKRDEHRADVLNGSNLPKDLFALLLSYVSRAYTYNVDRYDPSDVTIKIDALTDLTEQKLLTESLTVFVDSSDPDATPLTKALIENSMNNLSPRSRRNQMYQKHVSVFSTRN